MGKIALEFCHRGVHRHSAVICCFSISYAIYLLSIEVCYSPAMFLAKFTVYVGVEPHQIVKIDNSCQCTYV